jgi:ElaB/YqjD/DUF883 family membrane-anchored ribosome-binding protein
MTIESDRSASPPMTAGQSLRPPEQTASPTGQQASEVGQSAKEAGQKVMSEVSDQASSVAGTAKQQVDTLLSRTREELSQQAEARGQQTISMVRTWSDQLQALAEGRPTSSGNMLSFVREAQERVQSYADSLERRGPRAFMDDVSSFARRRPVAFLMAAGFAGFAVGRLVRSEKDSQQSSSGDGNGFSSYQPPMSQSTRAYEAGPTAYGDPVTYGEPVTYSDPVTYGEPTTYGDPTLPERP